VIIGSRSYDLLALNAGDGSIAWNYYYWFSWIESTAVVRDGIAYIGASDSQILHAIDAGTGRLVWEFDTAGSAWAEPAVSDDAVFIGAAGVADYMVKHDGGFFAVDRESGRGLWHIPSERPGEEKLWGFTSSPAVGDGMVFAGGLDGTVYAFSSSK
jgi:outer membrane protein assembly factor BamB